MHVLIRKTIAILCETLPDSISPPNTQVTTPKIWHLSFLCLLLYFTACSQPQTICKHCSSHLHVCHVLEHYGGPNKTNTQLQTLHKQYSTIIVWQLFVHCIFQIFSHIVTCSSSLFIHHSPILLPRAHRLFPKHNCMCISLGT